MLREIESKQVPPLAILCVVISIALVPIAISDDNVPIPADKSQVSAWFTSNVKPYADRKGTLDPNLEAAETNVTVIKVSQNGGGDFKTVTEAINSIPMGNNKRIIVWIGGGEYNEKVKIERAKPFITLFGDPQNMPKLTYSGTAQKFGTVDSATLIVESDYFMACNIIVAVMHYLSNFTSLLMSVCSQRYNYIFMHGSMH